MWISTAWPEPGSSGLVRAQSQLSFSSALAAAVSASEGLGGSALQAGGSINTAHAHAKASRIGPTEKTDRQRLMAVPFVAGALARGNAEDTRPSGPGPTTWPAPALARHSPLWAE